MLAACDFSFSRRVRESLRRCSALRSTVTQAPVVHNVFVLRLLAPYANLELAMFGDRKAIVPVRVHNRIVSTLSSGFAYCAILGSNQPIGLKVI